MSRILGDDHHEGSGKDSASVLPGWYVAIRDFKKDGVQPEHRQALATNGGGNGAEVRATEPERQDCTGSRQNALQIARRKAAVRSGRTRTISAGTSMTAFGRLRPVTSNTLTLEDPLELANP